MPIGHAEYKYRALGLTRIYGFAEVVLFRIIIRHEIFESLEDASICKQSMISSSLVISILRMLSYYSSITFLTVMSVDRYMAINLAMNQNVKKFRTKTAACVISAAAWILAILAVINILVYADVHECECQIYFPQNGMENALECF